jgi:hypothetical protein
MERENPVFIITGYKLFNNYEIFKHVMSEVMRQKGRPSLVLHCDVPTGTDPLAERWCLENKITFEPCPSGRSTKGKRGGFDRNTTMVERADVVCVFNHSTSKNTKDIVAKATKAAKVIYEVDITKYL